MFHINITLLLKVKNIYMFCVAEVPINRLNKFLTFNNQDVFIQNISIILVILEKQQGSIKKVHDADIKLTANFSIKKEMII